MRIPSSLRCSWSQSGATRTSFAYPDMSTVLLCRSLTTKSRSAFRDIGISIARIDTGGRGFEQLLYTPPGLRQPRVRVAWIDPQDHRGNQVARGCLRHDPLTLGENLRRDMGAVRLV